MRVDGGEDALRITVLAVPDCPNAAVAIERVNSALAGRAARVELVEVHDQEQAVRLGMRGSPTILVDGADLFPDSGTPSFSCRLYREPNNAVSGAPSEAALACALAGRTDRPDVGGVDECCTSTDALDVVGRDGRGRRAPAERGLRAVHQAVLRHFATTGAAPELADLEAAAASSGRLVADVLDELAVEDFLTLDEAGRIRAAYPFSAVPTRHRVQIEGGVSVWSMCAIDALGISAMLEADVVIDSSDPVSGEPVSGEPVTVTADETGMRWEPAGAVVFVGQRPGGGPAATACCDALNFFTDLTTARAWIAQHPGIPGRIVDQAEAVDIATETFGPLLAG